MSLLPPEILSESLPGGGLVIRFPRRDLGGARWLPWVLFIAGAGIFAFTVVWTCAFAFGFYKVLGPIGLLAGLLGLPGFLFAAALWGVATALRFGGPEIGISDGRLFVIERVGILPWKRSIDAASVQRLLVSNAIVRDSDGHSMQQPVLTEFAGLVAERSNGKRFWLTFGYPRPWLVAVAEHLSAELHAEAVLEPGESAAPIPIFDASSAAPGEIERREQPADSDVILQEIPGGFTLTIPARGVRRGSSGLFTFSLMWLGFMVIFTGVWVFVGTQVQPDGFGKELYFIVAIIGLFWLIGLGMLLAAINMGRRQAVIGVTHGELKLMIVSLFGTTRRDWRLSELETVRVGPSGMTVNDVPVMQLHIVPTAGRPFGLLTGRDVPELEWMATQLRQAVRPPREPA